MKIHEYQAREIFRQHGLPVPPDRVAETAERAGAAFTERFVDTDRLLGRP